MKGVLLGFWSCIFLLSLSSLVWSGLVWSGLVLSGLVWSGLGHDDTQVHTTFIHSYICSRIT